MNRSTYRPTPDKVPDHRSRGLARGAPVAKAASADEHVESPRGGAAANAHPSVDRGLRAYMLAIYNKVALGLLASAGVAYLTSSAPAARDLLFRTAVVDGAPRLIGMSLAGTLVAISPLVALLLFGAGRRDPSPRRAAALYWSTVCLIGASLGVLVLSFTGGSIAVSLASAAAAFGALSLVGYTTRKDLSAVGSFLLVGVIGLVVGLLVNLFIGSSALSFVTSALGVLIFAGLIAYDTQRLKLAYDAVADDPDRLAVATSEGALSLYINFINLFQFLLMLTSGERR